MLSARLLILFFLPVMPASAQSLSIVVKKHNQVIDRFWKGSVMTFQLENIKWEKGEVMEVKPDSFYIRSYTIKSIMSGPDTTYYGIDGYALHDVYALPKKGYLVEYFDGGWHITVAGSHVHWYWVKSGWIFRILGVGYIGLETLNGVIKHNFSLKSNAVGFGIAAAVAAGGVVLKKTYKVTHRVGRKYRLSIY